MGCRKPETEIFHKVLAQIKLAPEDVIFVDDDANNITIARSLGLHTLHINQQTTIFALEKLLNLEQFTQKESVI